MKRKIFALGFIVISLIGNYCFAGGNGGDGGLEKKYLAEVKTGGFPDNIHASIYGGGGSGGLHLAEQKSGGLVIQAEVTGSTGPVA